MNCFSLFGLFSAIKILLKDRSLIATILYKDYDTFLCINKSGILTLLKNNTLLFSEKKEIKTAVDIIEMSRSIEKIFIENTLLYDSKIVPLIDRELEILFYLSILADNNKLSLVIGNVKINYAPNMFIVLKDGKYGIYNHVKTLLPKLLELDYNKIKISLI